MTGELSAAASLNNEVTTNASYQSTIPRPAPRSARLAELESGPCYDTDAYELRPMTVDDIATGGDDGVVS